MADSELTASEALAAWLEHLAHERRLSPRTLEAYIHIGRHYLAFLERHRGEPQRLADLGTVSAAEVRAHMADRRSGARPLNARSLGQTLAAIRGFRFRVSTVALGRTSWQRFTSNGRTRLRHPIRCSAC